MRLLSLDVGKRNIGIAFCDTSVGIVFPRAPVVVKSEKQTVSEIKNIVIRDRIEKIIVGLPLNFDSTESHIQKYVEDFVKLLSKEIDIEIEFFDERFTTKIANLYTSKNVDSVSAKLLLEDYLKSKGL